MTAFTFDWYDDFKKTCSLLDGIREETGVSDSDVLDAYFSSAASRKLICSEPYTTKETEEIKQVCSHSESSLQDDEPGLYSYLMLMLIAAICKHHSVAPSVLYTAGRGSELFDGIHRCVIWLCHDDFEEVYESFESRFLELVDSGCSSKDSRR